MNEISTARQIQAALKDIVSDIALRKWCVERAIEAADKTQHMTAAEIYAFVTKPARDLSA